MYIVNINIFTEKHLSETLINLLDRFIILLIFLTVIFFFLLLLNYNFNFLPRFLKL